MYVLCMYTQQKNHRESRISFQKHNIKKYQNKKAKKRNISEARGDFEIRKNPKHLFCNSVSVISGNFFSQVN